MHRRPIVMAPLVWAVWGTLPPLAAAGQEPWIRLETRGCFGTCPAYTLSVSRDGRVTFRGEKFVLRKGVHRRSLGAADLARLQKAVEESDFWKLSEDCCNCRDVTDHPWTILEIAKAGATKKISHYDGCRAAPHTVPELAGNIVSLTGVLKWIGTAEQRARLRSPHWR